MNEGWTEVGKSPECVLSIDANTAKMSHCREGVHQNTPAVAVVFGNSPGERMQMDLSHVLRRR